jgi:hypothetical protein
MIKVLVDVDSMYSGKKALSLPGCCLPFCDRSDGDHRDDLGFCHRSKWCPHARRDSQVIAAYRDPVHFEKLKPYEAVPLALRKLQRCGWTLTFWTTRPKSQTFQIVKALKEAKVWDEALLLAPDSNLLCIEDLPLDFNYSVETTKLSLLEKCFGEDLLNPETYLIAIEGDPLEAAILQNYQPKILVTMAPQTWLTIIATAPNELLKTLLLERRPLHQSTLLKGDINDYTEHTSDSRKGTEPLPQ